MQYANTVASNATANATSISITFGGTYVQKSYTSFDTGFVTITSPVATVDYAIDIPFDYVDSNTITQINLLGGLDGDESGDWNGKTLIFSTQENYIGNYPNIQNNGWIQNNTIIPGYTEVTNGTSAVNKRSGVWSISVTNNLVNLTFVETILIGQVVAVRFGAKGGKTLEYNPSGIGIGAQTVPEYTNININTVQRKSPTTFDSRTTIFINGEDQYQLPFANDSYLKFPKTNIFQ